MAGALGEHVVVWDAGTGALVHHARQADARVVDVIFTPDSSGLIASASDRTVTHRSLDEWKDARVAPTTIDGAHRIGLAGFADDGATLIAIGGYQDGDSSLARFDTATLVWDDVWPAIHEGAVTSAAVSDDGGRVVTAATDGSVRVWDTATGELVHDLGRRGAPVRGVVFAGDAELVVADDEGIERMTTDPRRLLELVRASLTHGFSDAECVRANFGSPSACPTRDELTGRPPDAGAPEGEFRVAWTVDELATEMARSMETHFDAPLWDDGGPQRSFEGLATEIAGAYTLRLRDGRFELWRSAQDRPLCAGSVRYDAPRLSLLAERGSFCYPSVLFEGDVTVDDRELSVDPTTMRAEFPTLVLFGTRALERAA
jgi:hypothetical protein